jgi:hypothetical protein
MLPSGVVSGSGFASGSGKGEPASRGLSVFPCSRFGHVSNNGSGAPEEEKGIDGLLEMG